MSAKNLSRIQIQKNGSLVISDFWASLIGTTEKFYEFPERSEATATARIGLLDYGRLYGEEPPIQGTSGTSAFYIHGCPFKCVTCYQPEFFAPSARSYISANELVEAMFSSEKNGASSILLVIATFHDDVFRAIREAKAKGLNIPVVYKFAGKLSLDFLKMLLPYVDIFVPDLKAVSKQLLQIHRLSEDYFEGNIESIRFLADSGAKTIVRHLLVPSHKARIKELKEILRLIDFSKSNLSLSLLTQYYDRPSGMISAPPAREIYEMKKLCRESGCTLYVQSSDGTYDC